MPPTTGDPKALSKIANSLSPAKAEDYLRRGIERWPGNLVLKGQLAQALLDLDRPEESLETIAQIHLLDQNDLVGHGLKFKALLALNDPGGALKVADRYSSIRPNDVRSYGMKSQALLVLGHAQQALELADCALRIRPDNMVGLGIKIQALLALGRPQDALIAAEKSINIQPHNVIGYVHMAKVLLALDRPLRSLEMADQISRRSPDAAAGYGLKAEALLRLGRAEEAMKAADQSIKCQPSNDKGYAIKAKVLLALGRPQEAVDLIGGILGDGPGAIVSRLFMASIYMRAGQYDEAKSMAEPLVSDASLSPRDRNSARFIRSLIALKEGDYFTAQNHLYAMNRDYFHPGSFNLLRQMVEHGIADADRYGVYLDMAKASKQMSAEIVESLIPTHTATDPNPGNLVDRYRIDVLLDRELSELANGSVARSKFFATLYDPIPIDATASRVTSHPSSARGNL